MLVVCMVHCDGKVSENGGLSWCWNVLELCWAKKRQPCNIPYMSKGKSGEIMFFFRYHLIFQCVLITFFTFLLVMFLLFLFCEFTINPCSLTRASQSCLKRPHLNSSWADPNVNFQWYPTHTPPRQGLTDISEISGTFNWPVRHSHHLDSKWG